MTTALKPRTEALTNDLQELVDRGQIVAFQYDNPTGNKLTWTIVPKNETVDAVGTFHVESMSTAEAEAFAAGVRLGAKRKMGDGRTRSKSNPLRDQIVNEGKVEVEVAGKDANEAKRLRTSIFNAAYSLGLKGHFKVRTEEGKLVGEVTDKRALKSVKAKAA